jgi:hypothetical protein
MTFINSRETSIDYFFSGLFRYSLCLQATADFESAFGAGPVFRYACVNSLEYISFRLTLALFNSGTTFCRVVYLHRYINV